MKSIYYILLLLLMTACPVMAQQPYIVEPEQAHFLDGYIGHYEDASATKTLSQVVSQYKKQAFEVLPTSLLNSGYSASNHWLHIRLQSETQQTVFLEMDNPRINDLWFYELVGDSLVRQVITGDRLPFATRIFPNHNWVFPITVTAQTPKDIFVMAAKRHEVLGMRVQLWEATAFERHDRNNYLFWGVLLGFTVLILVINLVAFVATREANYFWFVGIILTIGFHISAQSGLGFQYFWANFPAFNWLDPQLLSGWLIMIAQLQFMQQFIGQKPGQSRAYWAVVCFKVGVTAALLVNVLLRIADVFPLQHFRWTFNLTLAFIIVSTLLAFWSIFERIRRRENVVLFYTLTFSVQLIGYLVVFFINLAFTQGRKPLFDIDSYFVIVGNFLFDLILLSSGILYFWFKKYRQQNEALLIALHKSEQEQSQKIIEALEIERNRIAEDLYDDVGAMLSTAIGFISSAVRKPEVKERFPILLEARKLLDRAIENLRTVSHNLMPKNFAQLGLSKSLAETIDKVTNTSDIEFAYMVVGNERRLNASTEVQVFRIASELINDILKNSEATQATVQLVYNHDHLSLIAEDDGPRTPFYNNLTSKVDFIQGKLDIDATEAGVTAIVEIPYQ